MFQPYLERAVSFFDAVSQPAGIEGEIMLPETAARLRSNHAVRVVFLVRRAATPADLRDPRGPNPWLRDAPAELVAGVIAEVVLWSSRVEKACKAASYTLLRPRRHLHRALAGAADALRLDDDQHERTDQ